MSRKRILNMIMLIAFIVSPLFGGITVGKAQPEPAAPAVSTPQPITPVNDEIGQSSDTGQMRTTTMAMRIAAALHINLNRKGTNKTFAGINADTKEMSPLAETTVAPANMLTALSQPDYFGVANWANSPLPQLDLTGNVIPGTGIRKFIDTLPGFCGVSAANLMGQCIPVGVPDTTTFAGSDYYEVAVVEYREQMSPDLPAPGTKLRGYVQVVPSTYPGAVALTTANGLTTNIIDRNGNQVYGANKPHYLGPMIIADGCSLEANPTTCLPTPVRLKFTNYLPNGPAGDLFIPVDTTYMGAGMGPGGSITHVNITNGGAGYTSTPTVGFTGGAGTGAAATATVINGKVVSITITAGGSGYTSAPAVSFTGGAGTGAAATAVLGGQPGEMYTQNRATLHLHGGNSPWISDGTPHQWTTPFGEVTSYSKGESSAYVPDMWFDANGNLISSCAGQMTCAVTGASNDPGLGSLTFYWTNQQSGRLLFYHDHSYGITRLNVYSGEAAGYLIADPTEETALKAAGVPGTIPDVHNLATADLTHLVPLVIQDKTFVPDSGAPGGQLSLTDPTWDTTAYGSAGDLWFPHVYIPNQNPADIMGANNFGRWDYGPWFWPPQNPAGFALQPYQCTSAAYPGGVGIAFPPLMCPGIPNPSGTPEAFMDTPVINGATYPTLTVDPTSYRFQMLMAGNDRTWNLQLYVAEPLSVAVTAGGSGYTLPPTVGFTGGGGSGALAVANMSNGTITSILITNVGGGYSIAPNVTITGNGTGAAATASIDLVTGTVSGIRITNGGSGYTTATVTIDPPAGCATGCITATATVNITAPGTVLSVTITNPGSGWTSAPGVTFTNAAGDTTGSGAAAVASVYSEVKMVDAVPHTASSAVPLCSQTTATSGAMLALATLDASGNPVNGTGLPAGCWPTTWPTDGRDGGVPDPLTAGPPFIQIGTESGLLPSPVVIPSTPVGFEYNRRSITVLNVYTHGLMLGPAERADVLVDFSKFAGQTLLLYNDAPAPVPAFDPRNDYYTGDPDQTLAGGAPTTLPGYGPNTRTIMQIKVNATAGTVLNMASLNTVVPATFTTQQGKMIVPEPAFPAGNGGAATPTYSSIQATSIPGWFGGGIDTVTLITGGSGYSSAPTVAVNGGGGTGATLALTFIGATVNNLTLTAGGTGYTAAPTVTISGGGGTGATATATITRKVNTITVTNGGNGYTSPPAVSFSGGGGSGATAVATISAGKVTAVTVTNGGSGYTSAPGVKFSGGGGSGARATATITGVVNGLLLTNGGTGYTSNPTVDFSGGSGTGAAATATYLPGTVASLIVTDAGTGYTSVPSIVFSGGGTPTIPASALANTPVTQYKSKAIQELFTLDYGRMNATLGVELPFTNFFTQTTIPYGYIDPPTELLKDGEVQIWKITHNGVDTHFIHFHLYDVQVMNRVGWDGMIKPPDANEIAWKDTVRMNPLEDIIIALRPMSQKLPWGLPNSIRPMDVTTSIGSNNPANTMGFANIDPSNAPATVNNDLINFGYEYVVHCHILGHEENDMMRSQLLGVPPSPPTSVIATRLGTGTTQTVNITWVDNSFNETGFTVQRATNLNGPWLSLTPSAPAAAGLGTPMAFTDTTIARRTTYYYRVVANNVIGYTQTYAAPAVGYPNMSVDSIPTLAAAPVTILSPVNELGTSIFADSFEIGLAPWSGVIGDVTINSLAAFGPQGGSLGMASGIGVEGQSAYVYDLSPNNESVYDANFYFNPNSTQAYDPIDIFLGIDQASQIVFGVQYQSVDLNTFQLRGWIMSNGQPVYTSWKVFATEPGDDDIVTNTVHKIEVAWMSGAIGGFTLYVDDERVGSVSGNLGPSLLDEVVLGPSLGLVGNSSGVMYFDEFSSSNVQGGVEYINYVPGLFK